MHRIIFSLLMTLTTCLVTLKYARSEGILYPRQSETRETLSLDGIWSFALSPMKNPLIGIKNKWYETGLSESNCGEVHLMPVPSSYNDVTINSTIRDHVGIVWYEREFYVPQSWDDNDTLIWLRFSSVSYAAKVWINGKLAMTHEIGHLPFQSEITQLLKFECKNRITVACDNTLLNDTIPQGNVQNINTDDGFKLIQTYTFDFYNYAGIDRPVTLYTTPINYIDDIMVETDIIDTLGIINYTITYVEKEKVACIVKLIDRDGKNIISQNSNKGKGLLKVESAELWWPYLMDENPGYLYTLQVELHSLNAETLDVYRQPVGIRKVSWTNSCLMLNNRPIYLHGFGRHEDSDIRGKGLDLPTIIRDYNLIKWVGANCYRTSHYPYADEIMDLADRFGIMIIDECPSVNTDIFSAELLRKHKDSLTELIQRDKNRPSVIMWSVANEPRTQKNASDKYFEDVVEHVKNLDGGRPVTMVTDVILGKDKAVKHMDIISFNRYNAWYQNSGQLHAITKNIIDEATAWHSKYNRPVLLSEYGADTVAGLHTEPEAMWSEEFQIKMMSKHFEAFEYLRAQKWFVGEFIWNFADFQTAQSVRRVNGNKKGIFTRNRQPKMSAHLLRKRYFLIANQLHQSTVPNDLFEYIIMPPDNVHPEL